MTLKGSKVYSNNNKGLYEPFRVEQAKKQYVDLKKNNIFKTKHLNRFTWKR